MSSLRIRYKTYEFDGVDIHLRTLRDTNQFEDVDGVAEESGISPATWPLFGVLWPAGEVLAKIMMKQKIKGLRILEMGCGIGLPSLVLNSRHADISASDRHPLSESFLNQNTQLNKAEEIPFFTSDWSELNKELGKFDLIIGSDLLYQQDNVEKLKNFIEEHANKRCEVILVDPIRGNLSKFKAAMGLLNFSHKVSKFEDFQGQVINFIR